jgi:hypothetical protein
MPWYLLAQLDCCCATLPKPKRKDRLCIGWGMHQPESEADLKALSLDLYAHVYYLPEVWYFCFYIIISRRVYWLLLHEVLQHVGTPICSISHTAGCGEIYDSSVVQHDASVYSEDASFQAHMCIFHPVVDELFTSVYYVWSRIMIIGSRSTKVSILHP